MSNNGVNSNVKETELIELLKGICDEYQDQIELVFHKDHDELFEVHSIILTPALVIEDIIKIVGFVPSKESLLYALRSTGL